MSVTLVEFVGFEGGGFEEVEFMGDSTVGTTPAPLSDKEDYVVTVIGNASSDPDD